MQKGNENLHASILDRLVDNEPEVSHEPVQYRLLSISQIRASVIRDLENLLNTRRQIASPPVEYTELNKSLFVYGLLDYTSENPRSPLVKKKLRQEVEKTISRFEPRLRNVTVHIDTQNNVDRNIKFKITGILVVEPVAEPISFDTYFDVNKGEYIISE